LRECMFLPMPACGLSLGAGLRAFRVSELHATASSTRGF
jgi:hypothetical protein